MLSRVANSIYWMSRYLERADNVARFIDVNTVLTLDMGWERENTQWDPLVKVSGDEEDFKNRYPAFNEKYVLHFLTFDDKNPNSILSCIQNARENARTVREIISSEMWETINVLYHLVQAHSRKKKIHDLQDFFVQIHKACHLFTGIAENTMSHGEGWHFARMGQLLERADKTARTLDVKYFILLPSGEVVDSPYDTVEWGAVLKSVSGFEMYRKQHNRINYRDVAQFLIFDPYFPRSIRFCIQTAARSLAFITNLLGTESIASEEIGKLCASIENSDINTILNNGLHEFIDMVQFNLNIIDQVLYQSFFAFEKTEIKTGRTVYT